MSVFMSVFCNQIHVLRQMLETFLEYNISTYHFFVDFKSAYDSVIRSSLFKALQEFKIPKKLISLTEKTLKTVKCRIKIGNDLSEPLMMDKGLKQGDGLSCLLFNIALEK